MTEGIEIIVYKVSGESETKRVAENTSYTLDIDQIVNSLNMESNVLASKIETEVRKSMPAYPPIIVQAEVRFYKGSLLMTATVTLLSWTGSVALNAVRDELSQVIRVAVQRAIAPALAVHGSGIVGAMEVTATAVPSVGQQFQRRRALCDKTGAISPTTIMVFLLTVLVLLLIADRFFVVAKRDSAYVPAPMTSQNTNSQK